MSAIWVGIFVCILPILICCGICETIAIDKGYNHGWAWGLFGPIGVMIEALRPFNIYDAVIEVGKPRCWWDYRTSFKEEKEE